MTERLKKRNKGGAPHVTNKKKTKPVKKNTVEYGPVIDTNRGLAPPRRQPLNPGLAPPKYLGDLNNTNGTIDKIKKFMKKANKSLKDANKIRPSLKDRYGK